MDDINEREHPWAAHVAIDKDSFKPKEYAALLQAMDYMWRIPEERTKIILAAEFAEQNRADMLQNLNHENLWRMPKKDAVLLEKAQDAPPEKILIRYTDDLNRALSSPAGAASLLGVVILANDLKAQVLDDKRNPHTITLHATLSHEFHHLCDPAILNIGRYAPAIQEDAVIAHNALLDAKHYNVAYIREGHATKPPQALQDAVDKGKDEEVEHYIQNVILDPAHGNHAIKNFLDERILTEALKYANQIGKKDYRIIEADDTMHKGFTGTTDAYFNQVHDKEALEESYTEVLQRRKQEIEKGGNAVASPFPVFANELEHVAKQHPELARNITVEDVSPENLGNLVSFLRREAEQNALGRGGK